MNFVQLLNRRQLRMGTLSALLKSDINTLLKCASRVTFCSNGLNMDAILKANQSNKSLNELSSKKKKSSVRGSLKSPTDAKSGTKSEQSDSKSLDEPTIIYPEWFNIILESPFTPDSRIDEGQHKQFKDFVEELDLTSTPSVTSILNETRTHTQMRGLDIWQAQMTRELGSEEKFQIYKQDIIDKGLNLHKCIQAKLAGEEDIEVSSKSAGHWESVGHMLANISDVVVLEEACVHTEMFYHGKADCVATYKDSVCVIDWKTSTKHKPLLSGTFDNPLQIAAYIGAMNRSRLLVRKGVPSLTNGLLVMAYRDGLPATVHMMNPRVVEKYWKKWTQRLYQYWTFKYRQSLAGGQNT